MVCTVQSATGYDVLAGYIQGWMDVDAHKGSFVQKVLTERGNHKKEEKKGILLAIGSIDRIPVCPYSLCLGHAIEGFSSFCSLKRDHTVLLFLFVIPFFFRKIKEIKGNKGPLLNDQKTSNLFLDGKNSPPLLVSPSFYFSWLSFSFEFFSP